MLRTPPCLASSSGPFLFARTARLLQKKTAATASSAYLAGATRTGSEEKWAQAAMEYLHEKNPLNDGRKRHAALQFERRLSTAFDRFCAVNERHFERRLSRLLARLSESLQTLKEMGLDGCLSEAVVLQSEQPPGNYRRPSLSPPRPGYEPGFGLDVPQLKNQQAEYPAVLRPTDSFQFTTADHSTHHQTHQYQEIAFVDVEEAADSAHADFEVGEHNRAPKNNKNKMENEKNDEKEKEETAADGASYFPFVDAHQVEDMTARLVEEMETIHGEIREAAPLTGVEGEGWEAYIALQQKALARQQLIFDLCNDPELRKRYETDEALRLAEWERRGMRPLEVEPSTEMIPTTSESSSSTTSSTSSLDNAQENDNLSDIASLKRVERWSERVRAPPQHFAQQPAYQPFRID